MTRLVLILSLLIAFAVDAEARTFHLNSNASGQHCTDSVADPGLGGSSQTWAQALACLTSGYQLGDRMIIHRGTGSTYNTQAGPVPQGNASNHTIFENYGYAGSYGSGEVVNLGYGFGASGMNTGGLNYVTIQGFKFGGFGVSSVHDFTLKDNEISGNSGGNGVEAYGVSNSQIIGNRIHDNGNPANGNQNHGLYMNGSGNLIAGNYFYNNTSCGLHLFYGLAGSPNNGNVIRDNVAYNNSAYGTDCAGILVSDGIGIQVFNNTVYNNSGRGITLYNDYTPANAAVYNNTVYGNLVGIEVWSGATGTIRNNIFWGNKSTDLINYGSAPTADHNLCSTTNGSWGATPCSVTTNPQFVSPAANDYHLQPSSPAINAGVPAIPPTTGPVTICASCGPGSTAITITSYSGTTRDIGWDEYIESGAPVQTPELVFSSGADTNSGTTLMDQSGKGHTCTFSTGVTWTTGSKYGTSALSFDGTGYVTCNDSNFLDVTNAMTIEAWVFPTQVESDFRSVITKGGGSVYQLFSSVTDYCGSGNSAGAFIGDDEYVACYSNPLPINIWSHVAMTYDRDASNPRMLFYVNGTQVATSSASGNILVSSDVLRIGGSEYGEYFRGKIDEIRIYNKALSAGQIVTDMGTPITAASPSVTAVRMGTGGIKCGAVSACLKLPGG